MKMRLITFATIATLTFSCLMEGAVYGQAFGGGGGFQGGGGMQGGGMQGGMQGGLGGGFNFPGGIMIDTQGVITPTFLKSKQKALSAKRLAAVAKTLPGDVNQPSPMRSVSLVRLEAECMKYAKEKKPIPPDLFFLAGLQRIDYLFVYPETKDIVIAGPAEGFASNGDRVVGVGTGRPPLQVDHLVVALRALKRAGELGCSIDPTKENLAALRKYVATNTGRTTPATARKRFAKMAEILGMQDVTVFGVPAESHFAEILVEADYRMKCIALGLEHPNVRGLKSQLAMTKPGGNSVQRWWFMPLYDAFHTTDDGDAFKFSGPRAQLMSQDEYVDALGNRSKAAYTLASTRKFAKQFTEKFPELADRSPVFAQLQNLFDLAVMAAVMKKERLAQRVGWTMSFFMNPGQAVVESGNAPKKVATVYNAKRSSRGLFIVNIGGGVTINPLRTVNSIEFKKDPAVRLESTRNTAATKELPKSHPWWWDSTN